MKKLKNILSALSILRRTPSAAIAAAWKRIIDPSEVNGNGGSAFPPNEDDAELIGSIIEAVISMAKDDEDKATKPGKADKP